MGRHRCVISVMTRLERAEPCRGRLCSPLVPSERPGQQMRFLKECLRLVGCCQKTQVHLLTSGRVVDCLLCSFSISLLLLYNQHNCTFAFLFALCASLKSFPKKVHFFHQTSVPFLFSNYDNLPSLWLFVQLVPSPPAVPPSLRRTSRPARCCCPGSPAATVCRLCATTRCSCGSFRTATGQSIPPPSTTKPPTTLFLGKTLSAF